MLPAAADEQGLLQGCETPTTSVAVDAAPWYVRPARALIMLAFLALLMDETEVKFLIAQNLFLP